MLTKVLNHHCPPEHGYFSLFWDTHDSSWPCLTENPETHKGRRRDGKQSKNKTRVEDVVKRHSLQKIREGEVLLF